MHACVSLNKKAVPMDLLSPGVSQVGSLHPAVGRAAQWVGLAMLLCKAAGGEVVAPGRGAGAGGSAHSWECPVVLSPGCSVGCWPGSKQGLVCFVFLVRAYCTRPSLRKKQQNSV